MFGNNIYVLVALIAFSYSYADECADFDVTYTHSGQKKQMTVQGCLTRQGSTFFLVSPDCKNHRACPLVQQVTTEPLVERGQVLNQSGSPGFNLCHLFRWSPRTVHVPYNEGTRSFVLCSPDDNYSTFMNADGLLHYYVEAVRSRDPASLSRTPKRGRKTKNPGFPKKQKNN